ncbi:MAG TPA: EAL domain-containing protein, partial [Solirubrobacterales bacterium]|nr:EAL domain-containing protein [Solirubrobacterales bacterium]
LFSSDAPLSLISRRVVLELTERAPLADIKALRKRVDRLRALGFRLALDDLGAGYAGLATFASLEPDVVKIDLGLVRDVDRDATKGMVLTSLIGLCRGLGMEVIAEGIESVAERDVLVAMGCDLLQGFLFARPGQGFPPARF